MGIEILAVGDEAQAELDAKNAEQASTGAEPEAAPAPVTEEVNDPADAVEKPDGEQPEEEKEQPEETEEGYFFGDTPVEIEVPAEISDALKEAKIDEATLLKELFAKDGKFELSEKTKSALDKKFGKVMVDGYLNLFRAQNTASVEKYKTDSAAFEAQVKANAEDFQTLVGGDEGWKELAEWAGEGLSEPELAQFNAVMQLPAEHYQAQRAVVEALQIKRAAALQQANGDTEIRLPTDGAQGSTSHKQGLPATLTRQEFQQLMFTDKYKSDPAYAQQIDAIRVRTQQLEAKARR